MKITAYYRVSTKRQGESGLGLEAQKAAVMDYAARNSAEIIREFIEVESGRKADDQRPQLALALPFARRAGSTLVVAKLDRLARNVEFLSKLMNSEVDFVACDNPTANRFTVHILAAVAEHEAEMISQRTKVALQAAKARGVLLGSARPGHWDGMEHLRESGLAKATVAAAESKRRKAVRDYADLLPHIIARRNAGLGLRAIAEALNEDGHRTRHGSAFTAATVKRIIDRSKT